MRRGEAATMGTSTPPSAYAAPVNAGDGNSFDSNRTANASVGDPHAIAAIQAGNKTLAKVPSLRDLEGLKSGEMNRADVEARLKEALLSKDPRAIIPENLHVHVNEQSMFSLARELKREGYADVKSWLSTPPQHRKENVLFKAAGWLLFEVAPFSWFFEREVFAVGTKPKSAA